MKRLFLGCFFALPLIVLAQNADSIVRQQQIIGVWQVSTVKVGDALRENFQFFPDGKFVYNFSQYDDAQRVLALRGHYRLANGMLYMNVESRDEISGGYFTKGSPGFQRSPFVLEEGKVKTITQIDSAGAKDPFIIKVCKRNESGKIVCIQIDSYSYYRLSDDPNAFNHHKGKG